jgi:hypothetical protein
MKHATTQRIFAYWNEVRGDRLAPYRFDIEPGRIGELLSEALIIERSADARFRIRLAGTRVCELFGSEFRGTPFLSLFSVAEAALVGRHLDVITAQGAVGVFNIHSSTDEGAETLSELILMPLVHGADEVDRYLGAWSIEPRAIGREAGVFGSHAILDYEMIWPRGRTTTCESMAVRQSPLAPNVRYARVVQHDRRRFLVYEGGRAR